MTIRNILETHLKSLVGTTITVHGYKHPKIPRFYQFEQYNAPLLEGWEYIGEIDVIVTDYNVDINNLRDSDGEFEVEAIEATICFIHDGSNRYIDIPIE